MDGAFAREIGVIAIRVLAAAAAGLAAVTAGCAKSGSVGDASNPATVEILNVSYDPTRELWRAINEAFLAGREGRTPKVVVKQSHGASASQARAVNDGLEADVVTLAMETDTDAIRKAGLIREGWQDRFPHRSAPYFSTIVFVVRKGNPKNVRDWPDLARPGVAVITPNPKTSGNGKLSFLAAWGAVVLRGGDDAAARDFVTTIYRNAPVLDAGARGATTTFSQKRIGDVHLTWENEAHLEVNEAGGELEIVYPPVSIRAEPLVAVVDENVDRRGTRAVAEEYLRFVYSPEGQRIVAQHRYRPTDEDVAREYAADFPDIRLFSIQEIAESWKAAQDRFFAEGKVFDEIFSRKAAK